MNDTRQCPYCGAANWVDAPACHACGADIQSSQTATCPGCAGLNWAASPSCYWCGAPLELGEPAREVASTLSPVLDESGSAETWVQETWESLVAEKHGHEYVGCESCGALNWPQSAVCHQCGSWLRPKAYGHRQAEPEVAVGRPESGANAGSDFVPAGDPGGPGVATPVATDMGDRSTSVTGPSSRNPGMDLDPRSSAVPVPQADPAASGTAQDKDRSRPAAVDDGKLLEHLDADDLARRRAGYAPPEEGPLRLGDILVEDGIITADELQEALRLQYSGSTRRRLGEVLIEAKFATEEQVTVALSRRLGITFVDLDSKPIDTSILRVVPMDLCIKLDAVPYQLGESDEIYLAMADPTNVVAADDLSVLTGRRVIVNAALPSAVARTLSRLTGDSLIEFHSAENEEDRARSLVDTLLSDVVRRRASDLHIEPKADRTLIRVRVDGQLKPLLTTDRDVHQPMVNRLKILSDLDIAERRQPQDGRVFLIVDGRRVHARVSTLPATNGEKIVLRIADEKTGIATLDDCGFGPTELDLFRDAISMSQGLVLITGPTGSGKTSTLYAALNEVARPELNLITLEDPVERELDVATQVQINEKTGLTFPVSLRSVLRQDPDIVMVGEVRDLETANITLRAALSGHLVFSTIHTNDTPSTLTRLIEMGIEPYLVGSALSLVVAQRLVRRLCSQCAEPVTAPREEAAAFGVRLPQLGQWREAKGCPNCFRSGFRGRVGIYEVLALTDAIRDVLRPGVGDGEIFRLAREAGLVTLWEQGLSSVAQGLTTMTEIGRVLRGTRVPADLAAARDPDDDVSQRPVGPGRA